VLLVGLLRSPYVRRVAISLQLLGLDFEHRSLSVFNDAEVFRAINPVLKAPTLVLDDGSRLMDSALILEYLMSLGASGRRLVPASAGEMRRCLWITGLALAACEKNNQVVYERMQRPHEKQHEPWVARVSGQLLAAYGEIERELAQEPLADTGSDIDQAGITAAVAWRFTQAMLAEVVPAAQFPLLSLYSDRVERLPEFRAAPYDGPYRSRR
jgi:glutathione S-transferase